MAQTNSWEQLAKRYLIVEMKKQDLTYEALQLKLEAIGVFKTKQNICNTINRGAFSFVFFLQCVRAMDLKKFYFE